MLSPYAVQDRFHLGDPAYNGDGALSEAELIRLEGWIMDFASVVVVMYTTDADWLLKRLGQKEEMFNNNKVLKANDVYAQIATGTYSYDYHVDVVWDVRDGRWPDDRTLNEWIDTWYRRIECWLTS